MKTLLLTLVVVTIVCLDLGYTRKCLNCSTRYCTTFHTCPNGQDLCFKRWYEGNQLGKHSSYLHSQLFLFLNPDWSSQMQLRTGGHVGLVCALPGFA
uniref:Uncharacterized protein n=1 Tax=Naja naja TaxID=35670 RepID=A0A8C6XA92_NAJNA